MDTFTAALDVLTEYGHSNALELANQIELVSTWRPRKRIKNFEADKKRLFEVIKSFYPTYSAGKIEAYQEKGRKFYKEDRRELTMEAVNSESRKEDLVFIRQIMMYILRVDCQYGLKTIAASFCGRDHSTAIHAKHTVNDQCDVNKQYKARLEEIRKVFLS